VRATIRRWLGIVDPGRGTVTFLPDGLVILGFPQGISQQQSFDVREAWVQRDPAKPFVFPWPVDVVDKRMTWK